MKILIILLFVFSAHADLKSISSKDYKLTKIVEEDEVMWGFDFLSQNEVLYTLKTGEIFYYHMQTKTKKKLNAPKSYLKGQGGLMDLLIHQNQVYVTFTDKVNDTFTTSLARGEYKSGEIKSFQKLFTADVISDTSRHFGSRLLIVGEHLYMTMGERGERKHAQDRSNHNGTILRLTLEGKAAEDNPFLANKKFKPEIWTYGNRNPQGIDINPVDGKIYSCEFGPRGGDELNLIEEGLNYGWPIITYGKEYWGPSIGPTHKEGMQQPIAHWTPSISPSGMTFYRGDKIPEWKGHLFLANLSSTHLRKLVIKDQKVIDQQILFYDLDERIRAVRTGKDGYLYFSTDSGQLVKVSLKTE
jgi:glucose/arabinose dehydrogenase